MYYYEINGNIVPQVRLIDRAVLEPPYIHRKRQDDGSVIEQCIKKRSARTDNGIQLEDHRENLGCSPHSSYCLVRVVGKHKGIDRPY